MKNALINFAPVMGELPRKQFWHLAKSAYSLRVFRLGF